MTKADYASKDPALVALKELRAELTFLIGKHTKNISDFCACIQISTATFYRIRSMKYVTLETWDKLKKGYCLIATHDEFKEFGQRYDSAYYYAFSNGW